MKEFPTLLHVKNKENFSEINYERVLSIFREEIYRQIIQYKTDADENNYFELDGFGRAYFDGDMDSIQKMAKTVVAELENLGWKCAFGFGDTALFVYSTEEKPKSCW